jgi:hypothetical protein
MRLTILALSTVLFSAHAGAADFKGIELGKVYSSDEIKAKAGYDMQFGLGNSIKCMTFCSGQVKLANGLARADFFTNSDDGAIASIDVTINEVDFIDIEKQLKSKYGKPTSTGHQVLQNAFGAKIVNTIDEWREANGDVITLMHYFDMENGSLSMSSAKYIAANAALKAARSKDGKI